MIAGNHHRSNAGAAARRHGGLDFFARRIDHADQPNKDQPFFHRFHAIGGRQGIQRAQGNPQDPLTVLRQLVIRQANAAADRLIQRHNLVAQPGALPFGEQHIHRPFAKGHIGRLPPKERMTIAGRRDAVNGGHTFALRGKRRFRHPWPLRLQGRFLQLKLSRCAHQCGLCGITNQRQRAILRSIKG